MPWTRYVVFIAVTGALTFVLHRYLWARLVRDAELPAPWSRVVTGALIVLAVMLMTAMPLARTLPRAVQKPLAMVAFSWLGLLFFLVVTLMAFDVVRFVVLVADRVRDAGPADPTRRVLLGRIVAASASVLAAGIAGWGMKTALGEVDIRRHRVPLARLPAGLEGLTIAQLTDVHVGQATIGRAFIEHIVAQTNALNADVIVITGDLVDGSVRQLREHVAPLAGLRAPLGVFFVTGNHEYYSGVDEWVAELGRLGIRVLRNERVELRRGDDVIDLAGVDDWSAKGFGKGHGHDLAAAVKGRDKTRELVLLAHQPRAIADAALHGVGLQLSGHTHGGQLMPFNLLVRLQQPYVVGMHRRGDTWIYVSRGTGYWGPPMRVAVPAEISHMTLVRA